MILLDGNMILNLSPMSLKNHWNMDNIDDFHEMNYKSEKSTYDDNGLGNWPAYVDSSRSSIGDTDDYETEASDGDNKSNRSDLSLKIKPRNSLAQNGNTSEIKTSVETEGEDSEEADDSTDEESPTLPRPPIVSPTSKSTSSTSVLAKSTSISKNKSGIAKNNIASKTFSTSLVPSTNVTNYKIPTESLTNPPSISGPPRLASWVMNSKRPFGIIDGRTTSSIQSKCNESGNSKMKMVNGDVIDMSLKGYNPSVIRKAMRKALLSKNRHNETNFYNSESNNMSLDEFIHSQDDDETVGGTNINVDTTNNYNNQDDTTNTFIPQNRNIPLSAFRNRISGNNAAAAQQEGLNYGLGVLNNIPQSLYPIRKTGMWRNTVNKQSPIFKRNALHSDFQKRVFCTRPPSALRSSSSMGSLAPKRSKRTKAHTTSGMDTINGSANSTELAASVEAQSFSTKKQDEFEDNSFKFDKLETGSLDSLFDELG
ncbi:hypothetical protein NADFUDRAFT_68882 [Nadsonia fulvescens var. elongata DSM 6958]|uniref:Uncharacterized protein n=1 Tax=Nadsonia fulvescens var. elongata DSM 6958 TaxID=857566 RepID=A0A1E3PND1_9ASCO|nr:hypothetical protein NADFUDRAFT_68882 [Nadsonia fulvescens var. elongata DSM 6958]